MNQSALSTVLIDNERTRVTEWKFGPGTATGVHTHEYDYVVVPLTSGRLKLTDEDGAESVSELQTGSPYFREAGVTHNVINHNQHMFVFIEIEYK